MAKGHRAGLTSSEGRHFGLTLGSAFLIIAAVALWRGHPPVAAVTSGIGALLIIAAVLLPARLGPVRHLWMALALLLSRVTTPIVMAIIYFLLLTPIGVLVRLRGRNPIARTVVNGSYWAPREKPGSDLKRQF